MSESNEILEIIKSLEGKSAEKKVFIILSQLNVRVAEEEVMERPKKLQEIIQARMKNACPACGGFGYDLNQALKSKCINCNGRGYVSGVEAEKIKLRNLERR